VTATWREIWDRPHRIYVNDRHRRVHYARIAADILSELPARPASVLDYGCGDALDADVVAAKCEKLFLCDSAPTLRTSLARRFAAMASIVVLSPEDVAQLPERSLDLVIVNSVLQYLSREECRALIETLRTKLAPKGRLVLADVVPPLGGIVADVLSLLGTAIREGFFLAALAGLVQTVFSDYRKLRNEVGLTTYDENDLRELVEAAGYTVARRPRNFGFNQNRMAFVAWPTR
jgi:SAM-dependent methyltransferase